MLTMNIFSHRAAWWRKKELDNKPQITKRAADVKAALPEKAAGKASF